MKKYFLSLLFFVFSIFSFSQSIKDSVDLVSFMDGIIETQMKENHIAGGVLAVVHDGKVVLTKGYGFSNVENQTKVDPTSTLFRIGSISKMFTWTAVMQLAAKGKLDLNEDINTYLKDFSIPEAFDQPITLNHLMTHTPGFEDKVIGLFALDSSKLLPLGTIIKNELPERVRPPYTQSSYSNHGTGMAAYIVEQVSGMSFNDYVEKNILQPLEMGHTTFRQPLPRNLKNSMSNGYSFKNSFIEKDFEFVPLYPVGAASASALDMTHFMLAFLQDGRYNEFQMLDSLTLVMMKGVAHRHHADVNPMRYGFMDISQNNYEVIGHGGDTFWFHSLMALLPEQKTGIFLSFNTDEAGGAYMDVFEAFMDRYYPDTLALAKPIKVSKEWLEKFTGEYKANRHPHSDITKIASLFGHIEVLAEDDGKLKVISPEESLLYIPIDSTTFREEFKNDRIAFGKDEDGDIAFMYSGLLSIFAFEKVNTIDKTITQMMIFIFIVIITLVALIYWPLVAVIRGKYGSQTFGVSKIPAGSKGVAWLNYFFYFIFLLGVMFSLSSPEDIVFGISGSLKGVMVLPIIMLLSTFGMLLLTFGILGSSRYKTRSKLYYLLLSLSSVLALWQLYYWNFIGFNF
ncbi:MAG: beta-lactamase family protein [Flammeovirgaceae bacterium]|nr:beta-lactamase family protein [Flammeovirgaceae bacterium]